MIGQEKEPAMFCRTVDFKIPTVERNDAPDLRTCCHGCQPSVHEWLEPCMSRLLAPLWPLPWRGVLEYGKADYNFD
jgi:hypothetical protein